MFGNLDFQISCLVARLNASNNLASVKALTEEEAGERRKISSDLWRVQKHKDNLMYQKSRMRCLKEGDSNSSFFYSWVKYKRRKTSILAIRLGNRWVEGVDDVKAEVVAHFQSMYTAQNRSRPLLDVIPFKHLCQEDNLRLTALFLPDEIKDAVWSCDGDKRPGPDGFKFCFLKMFWYTISEEVGLLVEEFHFRARLPKGICSSFAVLIPKK